MYFNIKYCTLTMTKNTLLKGNSKYTKKKKKNKSKKLSKLSEIC